MKRMIIGGLAAAPVPSGLAAAAPANAFTGYRNRDENGHISALIRDGINPSPVNETLSVGYEVFTKLRPGHSQTALINYLDTTTSGPRCRSMAVNRIEHAGGIITGHESNPQDVIDECMVGAS